ncbi:Acidic endochitinase SP2 [Smittium culicis]|nr:Acidic endochitinase SP2 [Smittium culicis]OMJ18839.1 Acidic endochitinase SP2 [Smittium culicis]
MQFISMTSSDKNIVTSKRELSMMLAHIIFETGGFRSLSETACKREDCSSIYGKSDTRNLDYRGRGFIQISYLKNYHDASKELFGDSRLVDNPLLVATNETINWKVTAWYWQKYVHSVPQVLLGYFGYSTKAINGPIECSLDSEASNVQKAKNRFLVYKHVLKEFAPNEYPIEAGCYS